MSDPIPTPAARPRRFDTGSCLLCLQPVAHRSPAVHLPPLDADARLRVMSRAVLHEACWERWADREAARALAIAYWRHRPEEVPSVGLVHEDEDVLVLFSRSNPAVASIFVVPTATGLSLCVDGGDWETWLAKGRSPTGTAAAQGAALAPLRERLAARFPTIADAEQAVDRDASAAVAARLEAEAAAARAARLEANATLARQFEAGALRCPHCGGPAARWFEGTQTRAASVSCGDCGRSFGA